MFSNAVSLQPYTAASALIPGNGKFFCPILLPGLNPHDVGAGWQLADVDLLLHGTGHPHLCTDRHPLPRQGIDFHPRLLQLWPLKLQREQIRYRIGVKA